MQNLAGLADITSVDIQYTLPVICQGKDTQVGVQVLYLLSHADPKYGNFASKVADSIAADARIGLRMSRAGTDDQLSGLLGNELLEGDQVVPKDGDGSALQYQVLVDVVCEGVIVVNEDEVGSGGDRR